MKRRFGAALLASPLLFAGCAEESASPAAGLPAARHLVLVTIDTLRADHVGAYGYPRATTPRLDALAARGVRFDAAYSQAISTPPSHASILTGLNPPRHGLRDLHGGRLPESVETLAERLSGEGFATAAFVSALPLRSEHGLDQGFDVYDESFRQTKRPVERAANATNAQVSAWLAQRAERGPEEERVFLWVHYFDPHWPYFAPREQRAVFGEGERRRGDVIQPMDGNRGGPRVYADHHVERMSNLYDAEIRYTDQAVGALLDELQGAGLLHDAVVVVAADHGELLGEHFYFFGHWGVYEETARVPLLLVHPAGAFAGRVVDTAVGTVDIAPTALRWLGLSPPGEADGRDLTPLLEGAAWPAREIYTEQIEYFPVRSARDDDWLLIERGAETKPQTERRHTLYRRGEAEPTLAEAPDRRLRAALQDVLEGADGREVTPMPVPEEVEAQLRALGYTGSETGSETGWEPHREGEEDAR